MYELVALLGRMMAGEYGQAIDRGACFCGGVIMGFLTLVIVAAVGRAKDGDTSMAYMTGLEERPSWEREERPRKEER